MGAKGIILRMELRAAALKALLLTEPAPTRQFLPMRAPFNTTAWMPMSEPSPTLQPCNMTWWPTVTSSPSVSGEPMSVCSTLHSCTLLRAPTVIHSLSPRSTAPYQTLAPSPRLTRPMTVALSATQAVGAMRGRPSMVSPSW